jgi:DHA2 family lincomycin resistance protein-like MFS transporter
MVGIGFFFTPLFSMTMSSVAPNLYSHASATVGSLQQVAGAAGTAIFITAFTIVSSAQKVSQSSDSQSVIYGTKSAFVLGSIMWLVTIALAFAIRADKKTEVTA